MRRPTIFWLAMMICSGCLETQHRPGEDSGTDGDADIDGDTDSDADSDADSDPWCLYSELHQVGTTKVDLLFVVDNSRSMAEEQALLTRQIELMTRELLRPTPGPDGLSAPAVGDLHIGIVSPDMGSGGFAVQTCENSSSGDNGVLHAEGQLAGCTESYSASGCGRDQCPWLSHSRAAPDDGSEAGNPPIWEDFACIASLGTEGCGYEQPLEAALMALTVQARSGYPNEGFLRDDSILAIVFVTDEDDCSASNPELFDPMREDLGPANLRCVMHPEELYPIERYAEGFLSLRGGDSDRLILAGITGLPIDGSWSPGDPLEILQDYNTPDPINPNEILPTCETSMGRAYAPVRIIELIDMVGDNGVLDSICQGDWSSSFRAISRRIQSRLVGACLNQPMPSTEIGTCRVIETLTDDRPCPSPMIGPEGGRSGGWHRDLGLDGSGRRVCEVLPADYDGDGCPDGPCDCTSGDSEGCLQGWFYTEVDEVCENGQVHFTSDSLISDLSVVRIECAEGCEEPAW
jgi:hypothetical protein